VSGLSVKLGVWAFWAFYQEHYRSGATSAPHWLVTSDLDGLSVAFMLA